MLLRARWLAPVLLLLVAISSSAVAQSWKYVPPADSPIGVHMAGLPGGAAVVLYHTPASQWYLGLNVSKNIRIGEPSLVFRNADGSGVRYSLKRELIDIQFNPESDASSATIPIGPEALELLQSAAYMFFLTGGAGYAEYKIPLTGSRAAISRALDGVELDRQAEEDDRAHTIAQAASDEAQADARENALSSAVDECDRLTAHPWDKNATAPGVAWDDLDGERAVAACTAAFDQGSRHPRVIYQLGRANSKIGYEHAIVYFQQSAWEQDYPAAFYNLGYLHETGLYTPQDTAEAERAYRRGAELGNVPSQYKWGRISFEAASSRSQRLDAELLLQSSAVAGWPDALEYYGNLLTDGRSDITNPRMGVVYLTDASDNGRAGASYRLATFHRDGIYVSRDEEQYLFFLKRAAEQGHSQAQLDLGS